MKNIIEQEYNISREDRNLQNGHKSLVVWFTGLSGSGKSTIANRLEEKLFQTGARTYVLDGDNIRRGLSKELNFSEEHRTENNRRVAEVAKLFVDAGVIAITAFISPLEEHRSMAKEIIGKENFLEIYVNASLELCEERDVKGLYKKVRKGKIINFTGIDSPYEPPKNPEVEIMADEESVEESVEKVYRVLIKKLGTT